MTEEYPEIVVKDSNTRARLEEMHSIFNNSYREEDKAMEAEKRRTGDFPFA